MQEVSQTGDDSIFVAGNHVTVFYYNQAFFGAERGGGC